MEGTTPINKLGSINKGSTSGRPIRLRRVQLRQLRSPQQHQRRGQGHSQRLYVPGLVRHLLRFHAAMAFVCLFCRVIVFCSFAHVLNPGYPFQVGFKGKPTQPCGKVPILIPMREAMAWRFEEKQKKTHTKKTWTLTGNPWQIRETNGTEREPVRNLSLTSTSDGFLLGSGTDLAGRTGKGRWT